MTLPVVNNQTVVIDPGELPTIGEALASSFFDTVAADMALEGQRRAFASARRRRRKIDADLVQLIEEVRANYSASEVEMASLYAEGLRDDLIACYLTVNPVIAASPQGRERISAAVDGVIAGALAQLRPPPAVEAVAKKPKKQ